MFSHDKKVSPGFNVGIDLILWEVFSVGLDFINFKRGFAPILTVGLNIVY
jgi:hypothetical protein